MHEFFVGVGQTVFIFHISRAQQIQKAIADSGAAEIIQKLPDGLETQMSSTFSNLSVGQRQRLVIARAFLRDAPLLFLDEPTSALDVRSEELVTEAIGRLRHGRTCVMITHRISTARDADFVVGEAHDWRLVIASKVCLSPTFSVAVMNAGVVAESGNPVALLRNENSLFKACVLSIYIFCISSSSHQNTSYLQW